RRKPAAEGRRSHGSDWAHQSYGRKLSSPGNGDESRAARLLACAVLTWCSPVVRAHAAGEASAKTTNGALAPTLGAVAPARSARHAPKKDGRLPSLSRSVVRGPSSRRAGRHCR